MRKERRGSTGLDSEGDTIHWWLEKRHEKRELSKEASAALMQSEDALARGELDHGSRLLGEAILKLPLEGMGSARSIILRECASQLTESGAEHLEYTLLALHALTAE